MTLRYRHGPGIGHIAFRGTGELPKDTDYRIRLDGAAATLARAEAGQETVLAARPLPLQAGRWYALGIDVVGGSIKLSVDGATVLEATDPQPLPDGIMAFGCINGQGIAFDDIRVQAAGATPTTPAPTAPPPAGALSERFDAAQPPGWVLLPGATSAPNVDGGVLLCSEMGHGLWIADFPQDFTISLRYRHGQGIGQVLCRGTGELPRDTDYRLRLDGATATLARAELGQETVLTAARLPLQNGTWHGVTLTAIGGAIGLNVDGQPVLSATDPNPLPDGLMAFGCVNGREIAFDDISVVPAGTQPTQAPPVAETVDLSAAVDRWAVVRLPGAAAERLQQAGIPNLDALVARLQSGQQLTALSTQTGLPMERLLMAAQEGELLRILAPSRISRSEVLLLERLDIERPEDLSRFQGQEDRLHAAVSLFSQRIGLPPPSRERVGQWVSLAAAGQSRLPALPARRPLNRSPKPPGEPARLLWLGDGEPPHVPVRTTTDGGVPTVVTVVRIAKLLTSKMEIKPGEEGIREFEARNGGLYRVDLDLKRAGGHAVLAWVVEKPVVQLRLVGLQPGVALPPQPRLGLGGGAQAKLVAETTGWTPIISGGKELNVHLGSPDRMAYFWLENRNVPENGLLRLRLMVVKNVDLAAKGDGIEQGTPSDEVPDPVVRGTIDVTRQDPTRIEYGTTAELVLNSPADPGKNAPPIEVLEAALFQRRPEGQNPWEIEVRAEPIPNKYAPHLVDPITGAPSQYNEGYQVPIPVARDDANVPGTLTFDKGITQFSAPHPQTGVYRVLTGRWGTDIDRLRTTGDVVGSVAPGTNTPEKARITLALIGGAAVTTAYVGTLDYLEASTQFEWEEDGDDDGDGEFQLEARTFLTRQLSDAQRRDGPIPEPVVTVDRFPEWESFFQMPTSPSKVIACFPRWPFAAWEEPDLRAHDYLGISFVVKEHDTRTWWQEVKAVFEALIKLAQTVGKMWSGDVASVLSGMKDWVVFGYEQSNGQQDDVDDICGHPGILLNKTWDYGALKDPKGDAFVFPAVSAVGPDRKEFLDYVAIPAPEGKARGHYSLAHCDLNATTAITVHKVRRYVSWTDVQLLQFTPARDMDAMDIGWDMGLMGPLPVIDPGGHPFLVYARSVVKRDDANDWQSFTTPNVVHAAPGTFDWMDVWDQNMPTWEVQTDDQGNALPLTIRQPALPAYEQHGALLTPKYVPKAARPASFTYYEITLWDADPGPDEYIGTFSYTFFHDEFRANCGKTLTPNEETGVPDQIRYWKEGPFYVGEFDLHHLGAYLAQIKLRVYLYMWEG